MRTNYLLALGPLGLIGFAGFLTGNAGFFGFFGFFSFFLLCKHKYSSRQALERAGLSAFIVSTAGTAAAIIALAITGSMKLGVQFFALTYLMQTVTFVLSLIGYEENYGKRTDRY